MRRRHGDPGRQLCPPACPRSPHAQPGQERGRPTPAESARMLQEPLPPTETAGKVPLIPALRRGFPCRFDRNLSSFPERPRGWHRTPAALPREASYSQHHPCPPCCHRGPFEGSFPRARGKLWRNQRLVSAKKQAPEQPCGCVARAACPILATAPGASGTCGRRGAHRHGHPGSPGHAVASRAGFAAGLLTPPAARKPFGKAPPLFTRWKTTPPPTPSLDVLAGPSLVYCSLPRTMENFSDF